MHSFDALLAELIRILSDSGLPQTFNEVLPQRNPCVCLVPTWQSSYKTFSKFCLWLCLIYIALPPRCSTTLRSSLSCWFHLLCLSTSLSKPAEFRSASSVHGYQNPHRSVTPSWCEASKTSQAWNQTNSLQMHKHNIHSQHINNTHRHSFNT